jgi:hypothetical protein
MAEICAICIRVRQDINVAVTHIHGTAFCEEHAVIEMTSFNPGKQYRKEAKANGHNYGFDKEQKS